MKLVVYTAQAQVKFLTINQNDHIIDHIYAARLCERKDKHEKNDKYKPICVYTHTQLQTYLSEVWVGVESTLVTDGGLTLGAGVVVGYSRRVGQLCGRAHWAQFAARHRCNLRQRVG